MQANAATIENSNIGFASLNSPGALLERTFVRMFGCKHMNMGRPLTLGGETYRACLDCGAHRRFDTNVWSMYGPYYF